MVRMKEACGQVGGSGVRQPPIRGFMDDFTITTPYAGKMGPKYTGGDGTMGKNDIQVQEVKEHRDQESGSGMFELQVKGEVIP